MSKYSDKIASIGDFLNKVDVFSRIWLEEKVDTAANPEIQRVIFNPPATIVIWDDGTKTIVKAQEGDTYSKELGLAMCCAKKYFGNKGNFNDQFKKFLN